MAIIYPWMAAMIHGVKVRFTKITECTGPVILFIVQKWHILSPVVYMHNCRTTDTTGCVYCTPALVTLCIKGQLTYSGTLWRNEIPSKKTFGQFHQNSFSYLAVFLLLKSGQNIIKLCIKINGTIFSFV